MKTYSVMHKSKLSLTQWGYAVYLIITSLKGVSSMKLARDLGVTQKTAWYLGHRIRAALGKTMDGAALFQGPVEVDETYIGGSNRNRHASRKRPRGKAPVAAILDRASGKLRAEAVFDTMKMELHGFIGEFVAPTAMVYTDDHPSYRGLPNAHRVVTHSIDEWVAGDAHINGVESFWATLKRGIAGAYHRLSAKHLDRYVQEFACRHNLRKLDTIGQMECVVRASFGHRMTFESLIGQAA